MSGPAPLPRSTPAEAGIASRSVLDLLDDLDELGIELHSLMVLRGGAVAVEGWWEPYRPDHRHLLYSLSKSFTSAAIGMLVDDGRLDLDARLVDLLGPEVDVDASERVTAMTVRQALTMTTGHTVDPILPMFGWTIENPGEDWLTGFFELEPEAEPGSVFTYNQLATYCLSRIVTRLTGERVVDFLGPRLFEPLGIDGPRWLTDGRGHDWGFSGLHLRTEDIARFGALVAADGRWGDRRILSADWIGEATRSQVPNDRSHRAEGDLETNPDWMLGYGYQFWMTRHGFRGDGALGQFCVVWPEHDVVLVTTAATEDMQGLLDAFDRNLATTLDRPTPDDDERLAGRLATLALSSTVDQGGTNEPVTAANDGSGAARRLRSVTLRPSDDGWDLDLDLTTGSATIPVGRDRWLDGTWPSTPPVPVAATGGWDAAGRHQIQVAFLEGPHRLLLAIDPATGVLAPSWLHFPLHGADPGDFAVS